ncbi:MAG: hypothetical protein COC19_01655 [SAR86 cluster bacterium]|uniref:DUF1249 domain-containing protein n=1 Tax=SAR86 cluster bacterium TaxID=2030880 RepID=A0A2A4MTC4_9GAMM|nr:MAG: hypothetical protein COC19_01655 [SAR86 cluster bacterium]
MSRSQYSVDLIKQAAECDANYIRLLKLVPALQQIREQALAKVTIKPGSVRQKLFKFCVSEWGVNAENIEVEIRIIEEFKYTTTVELILKPIFKQWMSKPSLLIRVYHDASTSEVISYQGHRNFLPRYSLPNAKMYHRDEKMQVNQLLGECLSQCLQTGRCADLPQEMLQAK